MSAYLNRRTAIAGGLAATAAAWAAGAAAQRAYTIPQDHLPKMVPVSEEYQPGEIHVDPWRYFLYWVTEERRAVRYVIGVARASLYEPGVYTVGAKREWPSWRPTDEMIERDPEAYEQYKDGMPGGPNNPLGARALYLFEGQRDTYLRIHGTPEPWTVMSSRSNGCVRLINSHIEHLYTLVPNGTRVTLHG